MPTAMEEIKWHQRKDSGDLMLCPQSLFSVSTQKPVVEVASRTQPVYVEARMRDHCVADAQITHIWREPTMSVQIVI